MLLGIEKCGHRDEGKTTKESGRLHVFKTLKFKLQKIYNMASKTLRTQTLIVSSWCVRIYYIVGLLCFQL